MTLRQLWLLFFQLTDSAWMEHHVWSVRSKHGQYAKDSVMRALQCAGSEVSKAVNTSEECPPPSDSCQCIKKATVNTAAPLVELYIFTSKCTQAAVSPVSYVTQKWVTSKRTSINSEWEGICLNFMHVQIYVCGRLGLCHKGWLILTQVDSPPAAVIYSTTHAEDWGAFKLVTFPLWKYPLAW